MIYSTPLQDPYVCCRVCVRIIAVFRNDDNMDSSVYTTEDGDVRVLGGSRVTRPFLKRRRLTVLDV